MARDEEALGELSLVRGGGDDDALAGEMLGNELNLLIGQGQEEGEGGGRGEGGGERRVRQRAVKRVDPGMSVLQDSVLGMHPDGKDLPTYSFTKQFLTFPHKHTHAHTHTHTFL